MYYYFKIRKKNGVKWRLLRNEGRILIFDREGNAKNYIKNIEDKFFYKLIQTKLLPSKRGSSIYRRKYIKIE